MYSKTHRLPIDKSELCESLGKMWNSHASSYKSGKSIKQVLLDCMVWPFRHPTWMGSPMFVDGRCGAPDLRQCTVYPVLGIPVYSLFYGVWLMILLA